MNLSYDTTVDTSYGFTGIIAVIIAIFWIIMALLLIFTFISIYKIFKNANKPGYAVIIPIYRELILCDIAGVKWWYSLLFYIPLVNFYAMYVVYKSLVTKFNKPNSFVYGMILLPFVYFSILAFKSEYTNEKEVQSMVDNEIEEIDDVIIEEDNLNNY